MDLSKEQWKRVEPVIVEARPERKQNRGRPRGDDRKLLNGQLWILRTGAQWEDLPERYGSYQTCHRRFQEWVNNGVFSRILELLYGDLMERGDIGLDEWFIDGMFVPAKKGGMRLERLNEAKAARSWVLPTAMVFRSEPTLKLLAHMRSPLYKTPSDKPWGKRNQST